MQFLCEMEGAGVYSAEHVLCPRDLGGSMKMAIEKSVRKYKREHGCEPCVVLTCAQAQSLADELRAEAEAETAAEEPASE